MHKKMCMGEQKIVQNLDLTVCIFKIRRQNVFEIILGFVLIEDNQSVDNDGPTDPKRRSR